MWLCGALFNLRQYSDKQKSEAGIQSSIQTQVVNAHYTRNVLDDTKDTRSRPNLSCRIYIGSAVRNLGILQNIRKYRERDDKLRVNACVMKQVLVITMEQVPVITR